VYNTCKCSQLYAVHHNDTVNAELNSGRYSKAYVEMNLGMHDRLSEISFRETKIIFKNIFPYENMFQGPKGYVEQMCEVHMQYRNSTTKWRFYTFFDLIPLYTL